jgi:hypothetical protein
LKSLIYLSEILADCDGVNHEADYVRAEMVSIQIVMLDRYLEKWWVGKSIAFSASKSIQGSAPFNP